MSEYIEIMKMDERSKLPTRAHEGDAGLDIYSLESFQLEPGQGKVIRSGIAMAIPSKHVGIIADRSSLGKRGIKTLGGIIDAGYRGEVHIVLWNLSTEIQRLESGERIAQLLIVPIVTPLPNEVSGLDSTSRGAKGFGSSGK